MGLRRRTRPVVHFANETFEMKDVGKIYVVDISGKNVRLTGNVADQDIDVWLTVGENLSLDSIRISIN